MKFFYAIAFGLFLLNISLCNAQSAFEPLDNIQMHRIERLEIKSGQLANTFHSSIKPFEREDIVKYINNLADSSTQNFNPIDWANINYLQNDSWEFNSKNNVNNISKNKLFKYIYHVKSDMFNAKANDYDVHLSPIVGLYTGKDSKVGDLPSKNVFTQTRGFEFRARISKKLGIYTMLSENVVLQPNYIVNFYKITEAIPNQAFVKVKNEDVTKLQTDYFNATGYITFDPIKNLNLTFGNDRNFIGSGIRSLIMSDFSPAYFQLKSTLKIGKFQYVSIMGRMVNYQVEKSVNSEVSYPPKFINFHHLNLNVTRNLNVGVFEAVMFGKRDYGFELVYLNPVIFSRYLEGYLGSKDNSIMGADFKWNIFKKFGIYGQFVLDEYNKVEFKKDLWWSKKYAYQLGLKYIDFMDINNLDLQVEYNFVRPYTYSHFSENTNFVNYNQAIAHPLGANFREILLVAKYQPLPNAFISITQMIANKGEDMNGFNYGGNLLLDNALGKPSFYGVKTTQGFLNKIRLTNINLSYMVFHNMFLEANYMLRKDSYNRKPESLQTIGLRWNLQNNKVLF